MVPASPATNRFSRMRTWDPAEILHIIDERKFAPDNPYFRLDVKTIKDSRKSFKSSTPEGTPERPNKQPKLQESKATCGLTIWEGFPNVVLVQESIGCTIRVQVRQETGERYAKVELDRPFRVYCQELVPKSGKPSAAQRYSMQLTLQAGDLDTPWPPLDLHKVPLPENEVTIDADGSKVRFPLLVTTYSRFPHCPSKEEEALLHLTAWQDTKQYKPKLALQIDAGWIEPQRASDTYEEWQKTKLVEIKKQSALARKAAPSSSLSVPSLSLRDSMPGIKVKTTWYMEHRSIHVSQHTFDGLVCPLCNGTEFGSTDTYWLHLVNGHDIFKFDVSTRYPREKDHDNKKLRLTVKVEIKDTYETGQDGTKKAVGENFVRLPGSNGVVETLALRPFNTFFDLQQYLEQDRSKNFAKGRGNDRRFQTNGRGSRSASAFDSGRATPITVPDLTRPAAKVPDLTAPHRKRYPVPPAPDGVTFFSLRLKRPLKEGEELSESDDEIDDEWLVEKQYARIDSLKDLTPEEKSFMKRHDRHMLRENVTSNLHYREALVRFCRLNRQWLGRKDIRREFAKKLAALQLEGVIRIQQVFEYMSIVNARPSKEELEAACEDASESSQSPEASNLRFYSRCAVCQSPIRSLDDIERCNNPACFNDCHIDCSDRLFDSHDQDVSNGRTCRPCLGLSQKEPPPPSPAYFSKSSLSLSGSGDIIQSSKSGLRSDRNGYSLPVDADKAETSDLNLSGKLIQDSPSKLSNGRRNTTPKQLLEPPEQRWSHSPQGPGTRYQPIALDGEEDFPVGRDRSRIQQSQGGRSVTSPLYGASDSERQHSHQQRTHQQLGHQLEPSRSWNGFTSSEVSHRQSTAGARPQARRPHEL